jgi:hypothetical protein
VVAVRHLITLLESLPGPDAARMLRTLAGTPRTKQAPRGDASLR